MNGNDRRASYNAIYFDSFGAEHIPKEIKKFIGNKNIRKYIYKLKSDESIMYGYFCIGFIAFILQGKILLVYINLFSSIDYEKNDEIMPKQFQ